MLGCDPTGTMKIKALHSILLAALATAPLAVHAFDPIVIKDIRVEGLQRTDPGTVFNYLPVKVGDRLDESRARDSVKALFATGFFNDIRVEVDQDVLVISLEERPTIAQIGIAGAESITKEQIEKALKFQNFSEGRIFQQDVLDNAINELKQQYYARGRYSVTITPTVSKLERNRVGVQFEIKEGIVARIKQINIVGNQVFTEDELLDEFGLSETTWTTWYSSSDQYSKQKLSGDQEKLRSYYMNRGYMDFRIDSTQVAVSEDRESVFLTLNLTEGKKFTIGEVKIAGNTIVANAELLRLVQLKKGEPFSREKITRSSAAITDRLGDEGFALANVNPMPEVDRETGVVNFTFFVDPGKKTYVRRINIVGNVQTRDEVVRREMRQLEAAQYSASKIKRSRQRIDQLGYFSEVNLETAAVADSVDQVDINVDVTEKKTGSMNLGVGFGQSEGLILNASLNQANFLGSGKNFGVEAVRSKASKTYSLSVNNPYATPEGLSFGWSTYYKTTDPSSISLGRYNTSAVGAGVNFGLPLTDENRLGVSFNAEDLKLQTTNSTEPPPYIVNYINRFGSRNSNFTASIGWSRDTRDSGVFPTSGAKTSLDIAANVPGSTTQYYKPSVSNQFFFPVYGKWVMLWNLEAAYLHEYGGSAVPFYRNLYAGGVGSVRGYSSSSLGPRDTRYNNPMGGDRRIVNNFEMMTPIPGVKDDKSLRLSAFGDMGGIWGKGEPLSTADLRKSVGVALTWYAPIGPIKLSYARPLQTKVGDDLERFQFQLGYLF